MNVKVPKASLRAFFESGWQALTGENSASPDTKSKGCGGDCSCGSKPENLKGAQGAQGAQGVEGTENAEREEDLHAEIPASAQLQELLAEPISRRQALGHMLKAAIAGAGVVVLKDSNASITGKAEGDSSVEPSSDPGAARLKFEEYLKKNYRVMSKSERKATVKRLEKLSRLNRGVDARISTKEAVDGVLFGYAFNISKCKGYMDCVKACKEENNHDQKSGIQYITIHEMQPGEMGLHGSNKKFFHEVPADDHFYLGTQCFHCENPPCTKVCPVGATWKEKDGIVVIDYDWCIGCRYCEAACPYFGRRFNWGEPELPTKDENPNQHYLGNRPRTKGVMEKCTFCVQRSREGRQPACVEACPTGARVFGNILDPKSEIRWVLDNKKVFRLKEELGTEPKFWYYMD